MGRGVAGAARKADQAASETVTLVLGEPSACAWGGETILLNGEPVGEISSAGYSPLAGSFVGLGYVRGDHANRAHEGTPGHIELWGDHVPVTLHEHWPAPARPA